MVIVQTNDAVYKKLASKMMLQQMVSTGRTYVSIGFEQNKSEIGKLCIELCTDICPKTCAQFMTLLQLPPGEGYMRSPIHRIVKSGFIQVQCFTLEECISFYQRVPTHGTVQPVNPSSCQSVDTLTSTLASVCLCESMYQFGLADYFVFLL